MKKTNIILYVLACLIIIAGLIVWKTKGFNLEIQYSTRDQINISNNTGIDANEVKNMISEVFGKNKRYFVQNVETFGNSVSIVADSITDEEKSQIIQKINEKYGTEIKSENVETVKIPFTRVSDVIKPFIIPAIITMIVMIVYFLIRFKILVWYKVLAKIVIIPIIAELLLYSIIAITRIPFGRIAISFGAVLYVIVIAIITNCFENEREKKIIEKLEENRKEI